MNGSDRWPCLLICASCLPACTRPQRLTHFARRLRSYLGGESVLEIAADVDFPPCMLLRHMLELLVPGPKQVRE